MYLGRIISAGKTENGKPFVAYRVSSRSFPNRQVKALEDEAAIIPKEGFEKDIFKNTYIAYNCLKLVDDIAIISNGSQTDPIADKIALGMNIRDALAYSLITLDYEKDDYNTPRIAAVVKGDEGSYEAYIGIVTDNKVLVEKIDDDGAQFISTYEKNTPEDVIYSAENPNDACKFIFDEGDFAEFEHPVCSVAAIFDEKWNISGLNPK
ncbi:IMP cyclohydrolase [Methanobrevibacter olleyae]|uniref:IMP cyclohydrolase n=1 Tax=Methanobrevibacter olleyae TaxID=294671 RepID=A0A126R0E9_METOL|nr:IMP cyclohydrolase [Methanobrevibacter olleyae]AMK15853.1 IMP cyclohydrolase PurO [Methanobrevibacter olleyae]SFL20643.1 IMP cyclohydrolase [Methanobrevibacter olleyae]